MGDINIDLFKFETHPKTETYLDSILCNGYIPVIVKSTRITASSATLIDCIYTNNITSRSHSGTIITDVADHFFHIISTKAAQHKTSFSKNRLFSANNTNLFNVYRLYNGCSIHNKDKCVSVSWTYRLHVMNFELSYELFHQGRAFLQTFTVFPIRRFPMYLNSVGCNEYGAVCYVVYHILQHV